jgi:hypothetical protein
MTSSQKFHLPVARSVVFSGAERHPLEGNDESSEC